MNLIPIAGGKLGHVYMHVFLESILYHRMREFL
jgi:hypothetical protein